MRGTREIGARRPGLARPGQRPLRRFDFAHFLPAAPGMLAALTPLPESRVSANSDGSAEVTCACGALPHHLEPARSVLCACDRLFVHLGRGDVRGCRTEAPE